MRVGKVIANIPLLVPKRSSHVSVHLQHLRAFHQCVSSVSHRVDAERHGAC